MSQRNIALLDHNRRKAVNTKTLVQLMDNNSIRLGTTVDKGISFHLVEQANNT